MNIHTLLRLINDVATCVQREVLKSLDHVVYFVFRQINY